MDDTALSYIISSLAATSINEAVWKVRRKFNAAPPQEKKYQNSVITLDTAHITLKSRFYLKPNVSDSSVIELLSNIKFDPFPASAKSFQVFSSKEHGNIVVAVVESNEKLLALRKEILQLIELFVESKEEYEGDLYQPHLSIMYGVPDERIEEVLQFSEQTLLPFSYKMDNFYLLKNISGIKKEREIVYRSIS